MKGIKSGILLVVLLTVSPGEAVFQKINDDTNVVSLDSTDEHFWYVTSKSIRPEEYTRSFLGMTKKSPGKEPADSVTWYPAVVPGNAFSIKEFSDIKNSIHEVWYKKIIILPENIKNSLSVKLGIITDRDRVYFNGHLIGSHGEWDSRLPQAYDNIRIYEIPHALIHPGKPNIILVHVQRYFKEEIGIYRDKTEIGPSRKILHQFYKENTIALIFLIVYLTVGAYFIFLYFRRRKEHANLFFALFTFFLVIYQFLRTQFKYYIGLDFYTLKKIEYIVLMFLLPLIYYFLRSYFTFPKNKWMSRIDKGIFLPNLGLLTIATIISVTDEVTLYNHLNMTIVQPILWPIYLILTLGVLIYQAILKDRDAFYMLGGMAVIFISAFLDILSNRGVILLPRTMGYAFILFVMSLAIILANKFVRLNKEVEDLNENLEKKVKQRTEELQQTLTEVQELKHQQDGDYFLTSLLLEPLGKNHAEPSNVRVEFFLKEKKHFQFRKWTKEIGGDINIAHTIELREKKYTVFLNADAMGKSIQGAGGALVLGAIFYAIIERTKFSKIEKMKYPERWIKTAFIELQNVFEAFEGTMLISLVLGMIENDTGLYLSINAEHPFSILYRDNKADFLETEMTFRKIGTQDISNSLFIRTFPLQPGDVLFLGSDGRDDILLGMNEDSSRIINEDENKILEHITKANGNLEKTVENILATGQLTDDLSLIRVEFKDFGEEVSKEKNKSDFSFPESWETLDAKELIPKLENVRTEPGVLKILQKFYFQEKSWDKALLAGCDYLQIFPEDTEAMHYTALSAKALKKLEQASDIAERIHLRNPSNLKNLINLADIYRSMGNYPQAEKFLTKAEKLSPQEPNVSKLKKILKKMIQSF